MSLDPRGVEARGLASWSTPTPLSTLTPPSMLTPWAWAITILASASPPAERIRAELKVKEPYFAYVSRDGRVEVELSRDFLSVMWLEAAGRIAHVDGDLPVLRFSFGHPAPTIEEHSETLLRDRIRD